MNIALNLTYKVWVLNCLLSNKNIEKLLNHSISIYISLNIFATIIKLVYIYVVSWINVRIIAYANKSTHFYPIFTIYNIYIKTNEVAHAYTHTT